MDECCSLAAELIGYSLKYFNFWTARVLDIYSSMVERWISTEIANDLQSFRRISWPPSHFQFAQISEKNNDQYSYAFALHDYLYPTVELIGSTAESPSFITLLPSSSK